MNEIGFDFISDLYLGPNSEFNWEDKATSLYCIVAGNVSHDINTLMKTMATLSRYYQHIFYVPGTLEYDQLEEYVDLRTDEIVKALSFIPNVGVLHQDVVLIDGIALIGINGWANTHLNEFITDSMYRIQDAGYLAKCITKLQLHIDVKKIIVVSNAVPNKDLYFSEAPEYAKLQWDLLRTIEEYDTEKKMCTWLYGTYEKGVDTVIDDIHYINNPHPQDSPYWPKRITISM